MPPHRAGTCGPQGEGDWSPHHRQAGRSMDVRHRRLTTRFSVWLVSGLRSRGSLAGLECHARCAPTGRRLPRALRLLPHWLVRRHVQCGHAVGGREEGRLSMLGLPLRSDGKRFIEPQARASRRWRTGWATRPSSAGRGGEVSRGAVPSSRSRSRGCGCPGRRL